MPRPALPLALVLALVLAACAAGPSGTPRERPVFVNLTNAANESRTLELWVAEAPLDGIRVHRATGGDYTTNAGGPGLRGYGPGDSHVITSLSFPEEATLYGRYSLEPGGSLTRNVSEPYPATVFVVVVHDGDHVTSRVSVTCGDGPYGFRVQSTADGSSASYTC